VGWGVFKTRASGSRGGDVGHLHPVHMRPQAVGARGGWVGGWGWVMCWGGWVGGGCSLLGQVRGPGSASCTGKLTYSQPLSSTHTPGTQAQSGQPERSSLSLFIVGQAEGWTCDGEDVGQLHPGAPAGGEAGKRRGWARTGKGWPLGAHPCSSCTFVVHKMHPCCMQSGYFKWFIREPVCGVDVSAPHR
jgi:hypothetical protein